jgi:hypothetical protein
MSENIIKPLLSELNYRVYHHLGKKVNCLKYVLDIFMKDDTLYTMDDLLNIIMSSEFEKRTFNFKSYDW